MRDGHAVMKRSGAELAKLQAITAHRDAMTSPGGPPQNALVPCYCPTDDACQVRPTTDTRHIVGWWPGVSLAIGATRWIQGI
jgi:hypothetical protein